MCFQGSLIMYSSYFEWIMIFKQGKQLSNLKIVINTVSLVYKIVHGITYICSAWLLGIRIATSCLLISNNTFE